MTLNLLTEQQIKWAATHDWFIGRAPGSGCIVVADRYTERDGSSHEDIITWSQGFRELRDWAGY